MADQRSITIRIDFEITDHDRLTEVTGPAVVTEQGDLIAQSDDQRAALAVTAAIIQQVNFDGTGLHLTRFEHVQD